MKIKVYSSRLYYRKLRSSQPNKILMCLCGTLLFLYIMFIAMVASDKRRGVSEVSTGLCGILAGLLHFATLSSISWMGVEGANMFLMIVYVMNSYVPRFMLKAALIAWGKFLLHCNRITETKLYINCVHCKSMLSLTICRKVLKAEKKKYIYIYISMLQLLR